MSFVIFHYLGFYEKGILCVYSFYNILKRKNELNINAAYFIAKEN